MYILKGYFAYSPYGFAVRNNFQWANKTKELMLNYGEEGYFYHLREKHIVDDDSSLMSAKGKTIGPLASKAFKK